MFKVKEGARREARGNKGERALRRFKVQCSKFKGNPIDVQIVQAVHPRCSVQVVVGKSSSSCSKSSKRSRAVAVATQRGPARDAARGILVRCRFPARESSACDIRFARCRVSNGRTTGILCDRKGGTVVWWTRFFPTSISRTRKSIECGQRKPANGGRLTKPARYLRSLMSQ
jgi:hypothetical protein